MFIAAPVEAKWYRHDAAIMGTQIHVEFWWQVSASQTHIDAQTIMSEVLAEMRRIDAAMSPYQTSSELSKVNRMAADTGVIVSHELFKVVQQAVRVSELTGGAFDVSYASIGKWYDYRKKIKPNADLIASLLPAVNYRHIILDAKRNEIRFTHAKLAMDLGGIAKGYAVDRSISILKKHGVKHAYIRAGGDSRLLGDKHGRPWLVGIQNPRDKNKLVAKLPLRNVAVSTSGDYERYFDSGGIRYHHIIDPKTGRSANQVRSVTVIGPNCMITDAFSTGVFVLGVKQGLDLIAGQNGLDAVIVDDKGKLHFSKRLLKKSPN